MFAHHLEIGLPNLEILRLIFDNTNPQPAIESWGAFARLMSKGFPKLEKLYITYELDHIKDQRPRIKLLSDGQRTESWNTYHEWDSLQVLHLPWQIMSCFGSLPASLPRNLRELVVDAKGYVGGPLGYDRKAMLTMMRSYYNMFTHMPFLRLIAFKGWALDRKLEEEKWRKGEMSEEQYCQEVVDELIEWNNLGKSVLGQNRHQG